MGATEVNAALINGMKVVRCYRDLLVEINQVVPKQKTELNRLVGDISLLSDTQMSEADPRSRGLTTDAEALRSFKLCFKFCQALSGWNLASVAVKLECGSLSQDSIVKLDKIMRCSAECWLRDYSSVSLQDVKSHFSGPLNHPDGANVGSAQSKSSVKSPDLDYPTASAVVAQRSREFPAAKHKLADLAWFQFTRSGQVSEVGTLLNVGMAYMRPDDAVDGYNYNFQLSNCEIEISLGESAIQPIKGLEISPRFERDKKSVPASIAWTTGEPPGRLAKWKVKPIGHQANLIGHFEEFTIAERPGPQHQNDTATLRVKGCDIRVWLSNGFPLASEGARRILQQWLRMNSFVDAEIAANGMVIISEQRLHDDS